MDVFVTVVSDCDHTIATLWRHIARTYKQMGSLRAATTEANLTITVAAMVPLLEECQRRLPYLNL